MTANITNAVGILLGLRIAWIDPRLFDTKRFVPRLPLPDAYPTVLELLL